MKYFAATLSFLTALALIYFMSGSVARAGVLMHLPFVLSGFFAGLLSVFIIEWGGE